jgi:L-ascorbate metabolism protein UlaG (beta-lactamase superfamily)
MVQHSMPLNGVQVTWLGHATFKLTTPEGKIILIDPWTYHNPACPDEYKHIEKVDLLLATHGHNDHIGDLIEIAREHAPTVVAIPELGKWFAAKGVKHIFSMNIGGIIEMQGVKITMTHADHTSSVDEAPFACVGVAAGYVLEFSNGFRLYHAGDTAAFPGMQLIHELYRPDVALLPMGDHHTMGPEEAAVATRLLQVSHVIPMHYGLTPRSLTTPAAFRRALTTLGLNNVEVIEMQPGQTLL